MRIVLPALLLCSFSVVLFGQEPSAKPTLSPGEPFVIPPSIEYESVANRTDQTELLARLPKELDPPSLQDEARFNPGIWATDVRIVRDVWCLEFAFKRLRIVDVDIPNATGNFDKKKVWYLVYRVKNLGPAEVADGKIIHVNSLLTSVVPEGNERILPVPGDTVPGNVTSLDDAPRTTPLELRQQAGIFVPKPGESKSIRFVPQFILATDRLVLGTKPVENPETGKTEWKTDETTVSYQDQIIPLALLKIKEREQMAAFPETTVSIADKDIAPGEELWGVAMWTDIDPRIHEFSIFVSGLTNAYKWLNKTVDGRYVTAGKIGEEYVNTGKVGEGRVLLRRVLRTDWFRAGDQYTVDESQITFGSKDGKMPESILDKTGEMTPEERKRLEDAIRIADTNNDDWVSPVEKTLYHLMQQDWLKPSYGYEWLFL